MTAALPGAWRTILASDYTALYQQHGKSEADAYIQDVASYVAQQTNTPASQWVATWTPDLKAPVNPLLASRANVAKVTFFPSKQPPPSSQATSELAPATTTPSSTWIYVGVAAAVVAAGGAYWWLYLRH